MFSELGKVPRVMRRMTAMTPIETVPQATVDGNRLLYVGTGQWDAYGDGGVPVAGTAPGPTEIRTLPLGK